MAARLSFDERCVISAMVGVGASARQIADELGRHSSTVRREINPPLLLCGVPSRR